ncbi:hypothetical protein C0Q70_08234 [Pomacea canaliculata]|uniref:Peptidase metallopeptidase domain-containing protein n=2 Tax=Pomacea canaliculata TaxID=400727 RepID=A0A2T7PHA0_POMCA|nr:hypothetical protein C0Q70_08234 [Pomacea canaliculata]
MISAKVCLRWTFLTTIVVAAWIEAAPARDSKSTDKVVVDKQEREIVQTRSESVASVRRERSATDTSGDDANTADNFLHAYGYFRKGKPLSLQTGLATGEAREESNEGDSTSDAVRMFQSYFGLPQTGRLDRVTMELMKKDRCGVADIPEENDKTTNLETPQSFALSGTKWEHDTLSWKLTKTTNKLSNEDQRRVMHEAFNVWSQTAPLTFREVRSNDNADIVILFGRNNHGDSYPFDGRGKVLAHAYGPGKSDLAGDAHFDDEEHWTRDAKTGSDLLMVASHELGHSLGLSHSRDPNALMYPYYGMQTALKLGDDDIQAIQSLYGTRLGPLPTTRRPPVVTQGSTASPQWTKSHMTAPTARATTRGPVTGSTTRPAGCNIDFDHVIEDDRNVYIGIKGDQAYRFTSEKLLPGYPVPVQSLFKGAPARPSTVFTSPEKKTTFFIEGNRLWRFTNNVHDGKTADIQFPEVIRFVLPLVDSAGNRRFFAFGTTYWFEYNFDEPSQLRPRSYSIVQYWPGVTTDVKYGIEWSDGHIYLVTPDSHVVLDHFRRPLKGGKQSGVPHWLQAVCMQTASLAG